MSCEYCQRKLRVDSTKLEGKIWCGGCKPGVVYISYPFGHEKGVSGKVTSYKEEFVPSYPPWTTWNGVMQCKEDSEEGIALKEMDKNYDIGFKTERDGSRTKLEGYIRGLWTSCKNVS